MVELNCLKKNYSDFSLDISFAIPEGRVSGLVGKNGAGKSTTIKAILGLIHPDGGWVKVFGKDSEKLDFQDKQDLGVALSESGFSGYLTIRQIIKILDNLYTRFDERRFLDLCAQLSLPLDKQIREFSTGMKAKLRVITALCHKARLLILDEPTSGLDVEARQEILDMLRNYLAENENCSILISSHISSDLENLCDDIYLIHDGEMILHEETDKVLENYGILKIDEITYENMDRAHLLSSRKESFGYSCFTNEKQYYAENYPGIIIEKGNIDDLILMMTKGEKR